MAENSEYVLEPLRDRADFTLYRGRQRGNHTPILAVAVAAEQPSPQSLRRLEHEYSLAAELDAAWAAQPLALTRHQGRAILILKDPGGEPLDRVIEQHKGHPIDLTRFLRIAIGLAAALAQAHRQGLIHKDVKPASALVDDSGHVWLTGFGVASKLRHERQVPVPPEVIAGTLAYMSPEQTGRMNRSMDTRSDLYSLGVTLYQMLTGVLPFAAADPLEWVHCHIARQPAAPSDRRGVPEPLSAIIMKLLAKNAEERYQTGAGLEADLRRCLAEWQSQGRIDPFTLGTDDSSDRLLMPEKLYGREREVDALLAAFDRVVAQGTAELVLVSGYSGVGKSSVVNELHKVLVPPRGLFAAGKFDQYKRDVPYATLAQAFRILVRQVLVKSEAEVEHWRQALLEALGPNGQLIANLIPEVEFVIGKQPPVAELPPQEARGRFQLVFRRFLGAFARPEHPLALFLDDLQWLDTATLELLERLITDPDMRHVLLIGAYRDNEVSSSHPLMRTLVAIREAGAKTREIVLASLRLNDVERLIADALRCDGNSASPLAQLVHEKTGGNPFFAIQFLTSLTEEGLLRFDRDAAAWVWDLRWLRAKSYSGNVVDLMVGKLQRLPGRTQNALQQLACLGNVAEIATLNVVFGQSEEETHSALLGAVHTGLILRLDDSYAFLHDRIQEAAYALIDEGQRAPAHLRIARVLLASLTADGLAEHLFNVANQFNRGVELLIDHNETVQVAAIDLRAGRKAKASAAYASARAYFAAGMALLDEGDWNGEYELMFSLWLERAECELLTGDFDTAWQLIEQVLPRAASKVDEAAVCCLKIQLQVIKSENQQAVATALPCLRGFGIDMPAHPTEQQVEAEYQAVWHALNGRSIESLIDLPLVTDPEMQAAMKVLSGIFAPAYLSDFNLACVQICRLVRISLQHGTSGASAYACACWVVGPGWVFHRYDEAYRFARLACDLVEKHGFIASQAKVYASTAVAAAWTRSLSTAIDFNQKSIRAAIEMGDLAFACFPVVVSVPYHLLRNDPLEVVWRESEMALDLTRKAKFGDLADIIVSQQRFVATMQGRTATFSAFNDAHFEEATFEAQLTGNRMPLLIFSYWNLKLEARFLSGDFTGALAAADKAKQSLEASSGQTTLLEYYYYAALTVSALYETAAADQRAVWGELLRTHREQLREWAENYPPTFADKHTLVLAEIARLEKRDADALRLYELAIHSAREHGFVQNEGLAHELAAQHCLALGLETAGYAHLHNARNCYDRWGAHGKVKQLEERHPRLREGRTIAASVTIGPPVGQLDVESIVKASQAISSEMVLPELIEKLLRIAVEHAGAERGLLILIREGEPRIEAEATTGPGTIDVIVHQKHVTPSDLAQSALLYVIRAQEAVLLDDASADKVYSKDEYVQRLRSKSILCLPILKQKKLVGALYLENNLTPYAFTPDRVTVLQLLASQAAISLENASLYSDLQREGRIFRHIVDTVPGFLCTMTARGQVEFINQGLLDYTGWTYEQFADWRPLLHPDEREMVVTRWMRSVETGDPYDIEHRIRGAEGVYRWFVVRGLAVRDADGDIVRWYMLITDINERRKTHEKLQQSEAFLAEAQSISKTGTFSWSTETNEITRTQELYAVFDFDPSLPVTLELIGSRVHPEDRPMWEDMIARARRAEDQFEYEYRIVMPDASIKYIHLIGHATHNAEGRLEYLSAAQDVTQRRMAEEQLRERERNSSLIVDSIPGLVVRMSAAGEVELANRQLLAYFGKSLEDVRNWITSGVVHPEDLPRAIETASDSFATGKPYEMEIRVRRFDGVYRWFQARGIPLRDAQGHILRWYALHTDIDDLKKAEEALRQAQGDLARINRVTTMGELAASLAHEITQPITGAMTNANTCLRKLGGDKPDLDEVRLVVSRFARDAQRAAEIVGRLRSQFQRGAQHREVIDVNEISRETVALLRDETVRYNISVRTELAADLPPTVGDRVQLQQVAMNLIVNSIEAMKDVDGIREMAIRSQRAENEQILVSVSDTGIGFPSQLAEQIFDPFFTTKSHGTGMGLRISRSIIESHGGRLWAVGTPGHGATFYLSLPPAPPG